MKEIIGMIHLKNNDIDQALKEIQIYQEAGFTGVIVENYFGSTKSVEKTLKESQDNFSINIGINILGSYFDAVSLSNKYQVDFIQADAIAGNYRQGNFTDFTKLDSVKLYGGVWPKYYNPVEGSDFEKDILLGKQKADVIVITGKGTGMETPLDKIKKAREVLGDYELIVGAGINHENAYEQLSIADGCIVGTSVKYNGKTENVVDPIRCKDLVKIINEIK